MLKLSKETYYELDLIDKELMRIKSTMSTKGDHSNCITGQDVDSIKLDLRDLKLKLEKLNDELSLKSNIKDVCTLVDIKANYEDVDKTFNNLY